MAVTLKQVRAVLDPEEPDYAGGKRLGPGALPALARLVREGDPMLASKAASLAAMIGGPEAGKVLEAAARHRAVGVRAAAAHGAQFLRSEQAEGVLLGLLDDASPAVAKVAARSAAGVARPKMREKLQAVVRSKRESFVRERFGRFEIELERRARSAQGGTTGTVAPSAARGEFLRPVQPGGPERP
jgi:hypothetical protein